MIVMYIDKDDCELLQKIYDIYHDHFSEHCLHGNASNWLLDMHTDDNTRVTVEYDCALVDTKFFL